MVPPVVTVAWVTDVPVGVAFAQRNSFMNWCFQSMGSRALYCSSVVACSFVNGGKYPFIVFRVAVVVIPLPAIVLSGTMIINVLVIIVIPNVGCISVRVISYIPVVLSGTVIVSGTVASDVFIAPVAFLLAPVQASVSTVVDYFVCSIVGRGRCWFFVTVFKFVELSVLPMH